MNGKTHLTGGLLTALAIERLSATIGQPAIPPDTTNVEIFSVSIPAILIALAAVGIGSLLPDLDEPNSLISNLPRVGRGLLRRTMGTRGIEGAIGQIIGLLLLALNLPTRLLSRLVRIVSFGHRGATHWLAVCFLLSLLAAVCFTPAGYPAAGLWLFVGWATHLALDMMTKSGLEVLRPFSGRNFWLLPKRLRIRTGNGVDVGLTALFSLTTTVLFYFLTLPAHWS